MNTITHPPPGGVQFISTPDAERQLLLNATPARKLAQHLYDAHLSASRVVAAAHRGRIDPAICRKKTLVDLTACPPRVSLRDYVCERIHDLTGLNYPVEIPPQHRSICDDVAADVEELLENDQPIGLLPLLLAHGENKHLNAAHRYRDAKREAERLSGVLGDVAHQALAGGWDGWAGRACEIGDTLRRCRADLFFSKRHCVSPSSLVQTQLLPLLRAGEATQNASQLQHIYQQPATATPPRSAGCSRFIARPHRQHSSSANHGSAGARAI